MESNLKWVHMARYELILTLHGALWLTILFKPLLTQKRVNNASHVHRARHYQNPLHQQKARAHMFSLFALVVHGLLFMRFGARAAICPWWGCVYHSC